MVPEQDALRPPELRAILHADVVGYSDLTAKSEALALQCVTAINQVFAETLPEHSGTFEPSAGDSFLALFPSAVGAVRASMEIQRRLADARQWFGRPLPLRIGVHMGEVTWTKLGLLGTSINTAARIQALADPGGVSISEDVYRAVRSKLTLDVVDTGPQHLKNIGDVRVYKVKLQQGIVEPPRRQRWFSRRDAMTAMVVLGIGGTTALLIVRTRGGGGGGGDTAQTTTTTLPPVPGAWPLAIGVMEIAPGPEVQDWMCSFTHKGLNALLSKFDELKVFSKDMIDWKKERTGRPSFEIARELGISKMISGDFFRANGKIVLQVRIVDVETGQQRTCDAQGSEDQLVAIQNDVGTQIIQALRVPVTKAEIQRVIATRTDVDVDVSKRFAEAFGGGEGDADTAPAEPPGAWLSWPPAAYAAAPGDEEAVKHLIERYRTALESKSLEQLTAIYVSLADNTREALNRYFQSANDLHVEFSNVSVLFEGEEALATFTRSDKFKDVQTGRDVNLEVRVSTVVGKQDGAWKIKALRKPS